MKKVGQLQSRERVRYCPRKGQIIVFLQSEGKEEGTPERTAPQR